MKLLQSRIATLTVLVVALVAQIPHASYVFTHIGTQQETWFSMLHGAAYAIALELAVLLFVVRGRLIESYGFALVSILINLSYYNMHDVNPFSSASFPAWLVSVALPVAIACYSHDVAHVDVAPSCATVDSEVVQVAKQEMIISQPVSDIAKHPATATQRRAQLAEWLSSNISIHVATVAKQFGVSEQLIRKELRVLREEVTT